MGEQEETSTFGGDEGTRKQVEPNFVVEEEQEQVVEENILRVLDSTDSFLTLMDSLSTILRQGWLEIASARHSMGASRVNGALLDLNFHSAATSLQVTHDGAHRKEMQPKFTLCQWASSTDRKYAGKTKSKEDKLHGQLLRHRGCSQLSEEEASSKDGSLLSVDDQVKQERSKSLSVFGTLVSPKLRAAQLSFETALETIVEIANVRSSMQSSFNQLQTEPKLTKE